MLTSLILSIALTSGSTQEEYRCYLGVLHAHSVLSPDFEPKQSTSSLSHLIQTGGAPAWNMTNGPYAAWKRAADQAKIDFLAITDHLHGKESGEPCAHEMPTNGYAFLLKCADKINSDPAYQGKFLAIPGMEWNTISAGNHLNIFFAKAAVPNSIHNGRFDQLLTQYIKGPAAEGANPSLLVQMNHPNQNSGSFLKNYGRSLYNSDSDFVRDFGDVYVGIEHINNSDGGNENAAEANTHRDGDALAKHYRKYLNAGFRLAPIGDHDNHRPNWGRHTAARTGVWSTELTKAGFVEAYKARRVFATEDDEMEVAFICEGRWMGDRVELPNSRRVTFEITINQRGNALTRAVDDEGPYEFWLFADRDGPGGQEAKAVKFDLNGSIVNKGTVPQGFTVQAQLTVNPGSYVYLHVRETRDKDGGQNADAWTAPIWFRSS